MSEKSQELIELQRLRDAGAKDREVYDLRVFVVGGGFQYLQMFYKAGFKGARSVEDADIVCFTGGADVTPKHYGEDAIPNTRFDEARDHYEIGVYQEALESTRPMIGICRGAQFLNVMNGGKLWQDVNNHAIGGRHAITDLRTGEIIEGMTSTHHQQMRPSDKAEILALAELSTMKRSENDRVSRKTPELDDVEVVWYKDTKCLCFQPHPEFHEDDPCRDYFLTLVDELVLPNC